MEFHFNHKELSGQEILVPAKFENMKNGHSFIGKDNMVDPLRLLSFTWGEHMEGVFEVIFELIPKRLFYGNILIKGINKMNLREFLIKGAF